MDPKSMLHGGQSSLAKLHWLAAILERKEFT